MDYRARKVYKDAKVVNEYDRKRFHSLKGKITDGLEKLMIEKAVEYISLPHCSKILDLPCGTGRISIFLAGKGYMVTGGDISQAMVEKAQANAQEVGVLDKTNFRVLNAEKINCPDKSFDAVVSLRFFGHLPHEIRLQVLRESRRVSKRYLILAYYLKNCLQGMLRNRKRLMNGIPWYPATFKDIEQEMKQANIKELKLFPLLKGISETLIVVGEIPDKR